MKKLLLLCFLFVASSMPFSAFASKSKAVAEPEVARIEIFEAKDIPNALLTVIFTIDENGKEVAQSFLLTDGEKGDLFDVFDHAKTMDFIKTLGNAEPIACLNIDVDEKK